MSGEGGWRVLTTGPARRDIVEALAHTRRVHGAIQADRYETWINALLARLVEGPHARGTRAVGGTGPRGLRSLSMSAVGARRGRHVAFFRGGADRTVTVLRILHDAMDPARHLVPEAGRGEAEDDGPPPGA